jgi:hypothetical protein
MEDLGLGAGLAALAFWGFIAVAVLAAVWDGIRKRDAQHETMRRLIESGQPIDQEMMKKLSLVSDSGEARHDQAFQITGLWLLPVAVGMAIFALILGSDKPEALAPLLGVSALLTCMGIGFLVAAKITGHWYPAGDDSTQDQRTE